MGCYRRWLLRFRLHLQCPVRLEDPVVPVRLEHPERLGYPGYLGFLALPGCLGDLVRPGCLGIRMVPEYLEMLVCPVGPERLGIRMDLEFLLCPENLLQVLHLTSIEMR